MSHFQGREDLKLLDISHYFRSCGRFQGNIVSSSRENTIKKLKKVILDGSPSIRIITDFDFTLTEFYITKENSLNQRITSHKRSLSCHDVIEHSVYFPEILSSEAKLLSGKYYPIEVNMSISHEERFKAMLSWAYESHEIIVRSQLTEATFIQIIQHAIENNIVQLRYKVVDVMKFCENNHIPFLIFSAGVANVLEEILKYETKDEYLFDSKPDIPLFYVISNRCVFNDMNIVDQFLEPTLHVLNKRSTYFINDSLFFTSETNQLRKNILLFGDSPGDVHMIDGLAHDVVLKVGFLNDKIKERLDLYLEIYDIVIIGHEYGFDLQLDLLEMIHSQSFSEALEKDVALIATEDEGLLSAVASEVSLVEIDKMGGDPTPSSSQKF